VIERRYTQINDFEKELVGKGTKVVKLFLHISYEEQSRRLQERLTEPDKNWKFNPNDIKERAFWDDYQSAYSIAITNCSTKWAPWYVIPANDKAYRDWAVSKVLLETLEEMDPQYPHPKLDVPSLIRRLKA
jgi:polyphosphate kinase 2 (PPK2 family)